LISIPVPERNDDLNIDKLISQYGNSLLRMSYLYLKDIHLAEDAVQDTFIRVYKSYPQFKGDAELKTWIMRIAINVCKNYRRSSWWKRVDVLESLNSIPAEAGLIPDLRDDTLLLEIMRLSPKYKEVILLFYYQDMTTREISQALNIPESTVSIRLKRAREKLKIKLKGWYYDDEN
jgi:RNA polymerase sigma factor (sigma-70 family)